MFFFQGTHPDGGAHAKFTNYSFDEEEFLRIVTLAEKHVKNHKAFKEFVKNSSEMNIGKEKISKDEL